MSFEVIVFIGNILNVVVYIFIIIIIIIVVFGVVERGVIGVAVRGAQFEADVVVLAKVPQTRRCMLIHPHIPATGVLIAWCVWWRLYDVVVVVDVAAVLDGSEEERLAGRQGGSVARAFEGVHVGSCPGQKGGRLQTRRNAGRTGVSVNLCDAFPLAAVHSAYGVVSCIDEGGIAHYHRQLQVGVANDDVLTARKRLLPLSGGTEVLLSAQLEPVLFQPADAAVRVVHSCCCSGTWNAWWWNVVLVSGAVDLAVQRLLSKATCLILNGGLFSRRNIKGMPRVFRVPVVEAV